MRDRRTRHGWSSIEVLAVVAIMMVIAATFVATFRGTSVAPGDIEARTSIDAALDGALRVAKDHGPHQVSSAELALEVPGIEVTADGGASSTDPGQVSFHPDASGWRYGLAAAVEDGCWMLFADFADNLASDRNADGDLSDPDRVFGFATAGSQPCTGAAATAELAVRAIVDGEGGSWRKPVRF